MIGNTVQLNEAKPLPDEWRWVRLGEICVINPPRPNGFTRLADASTTFVPMAAVDGNLGVISTPESRQYSEVSTGYTYFEEGDVIFAKITPCMQNGKHAIASNLVDGIGFGSTEFHVIRPNKLILPEWIYFFIRQPYFLQEATSYFVGAVGQQRVPDSFLADYNIPLPPLPEQKRIAAKVQELMKEVEHARTACEAQLEAAKALPQAYLRQVFESEKAKKWERRRLGEVGFISDGDWILAENFRTSGVRLLQVGNIGLGQFVDENKKFISKERAQELNCTYVLPDDILISRMPEPIGRAVIVPQLPYECITAVDCTIVRVNEETFDKQFLVYCLNSPKILASVASAASGATRQRISRKNLQRIELLIPPLPEQKRIAVELKDKMASAEKLKTVIEKQLEAIEALPQAVLRKAFSGEL